MALAPFFDKTALSAATLLKGFDRQGFEEQLTSNKIAIIFASQPERSSEQLVGIELLVNLLARLYPRLSILSEGGGEDHDRMGSLAKSINPDIEISASADDVTFFVATGETSFSASLMGKVPGVFIGAAGWTASVGTCGPFQWGRSNNTLGAAAAACLGAANAFRSVFRDQLEDCALDEKVTLDLRDYSVGGGVPADDANLGAIDLADSILIGVGAIGNAVIWSLARMPSVGGALTVIDHEQVELSNLQRYVLTDMTSPAVAKVDLAESALAGRGFKVTKAQVKWSDFLNRGNWQLPRIAVAVDSIDERIKISGALAKEVLNSWTQADEVGISRHRRYGKEACLACLYYPTGAVPNEDELIKNAVGLPEETMLIRDLLVTNKPVGRAFLERVSMALSIPLTELLSYENKALRQFYSEAVCGGMVLRLGANAKSAADVEVPMAFQSALAGVFLAAELVMAAGNLRKRPIQPVTRIRTSRPVPGYLLSPLAPVSRCTCQDNDFRSVYSAKYLSGQGN
jgi:hypothetical protein